MRKALILLLALTLAAIGGLTIAGTQLAARADAVTLQQTALYGDIRAAEGLQAESNLHSAHKLFWRLQFPVTEAPEAAVKASQYLQPPPYRDSHSHIPSGVQLNVYAQGGASTSGAFDLEDQEDLGEPFQALAPVFADVAARTSAGESHTETVRLANYFEYYPLQVQVDVDLFLLPGSAEPASQEIATAFAAYFRLPVLPDNTLTVTIGKTLPDTCRRSMSTTRKIPAPI